MDLRIFICGSIKCFSFFAIFLFLSFSLWGSSALSFRRLGLAGCVRFLLRCHRFNQRLVGKNILREYFLYPLALSSSSMGGVRFALSSTQKVTISPFPFTVTFAKLDGFYATSNLSFGRSTLDNQVVPTHAQTDTWGDISEILPCLSL